MPRLYEIRVGKLLDETWNEWFDGLTLIPQADGTTLLTGELPARAIAAKIAAKSPAMVKLAKEALTGIEDGNLEDKYRWEQGFTLEAYTMGDSQESRTAFVEKRDAKFEDK